MQCKLERSLCRLGAATALALALFGCASSAPQAEPVEITVGATQAGQSIRVGSNELLRVKLEGQPSTGYVWQLAEGDESLLRKLGEAVEAGPQIGGIDAQIFKFAGTAPGTVKLRFVQRRPWETAAPNAKSFEIVVDVEGAFTGSPPVAASTTQQLAVASAAAALSAPVFPARYNTCDVHGCTPIKDQGQCGSCWAFATVGAFENRLLQIDNVTRDLSEQYLVSCGFGSCTGAGNSFEAFIDSVPPGEPGAGAVYESDFPYVAADTACNAPHVHHEKAVSKGETVRILWTPEELIAHMKAQIYYEGPIIVGACADGDWGAYSGGIFRTVSNCINHNVVVTGWDDNNGDGFWYARNSWGTGWGEAGYARIAYGAATLDTMGYGVYGTTGTNARYRSGATVQAVDFDSQRGVTVSGTNLNGLNAGEFMCYFGVDLTGVTSLDVRLSNGGTSTFNVRADAYADTISFNNLLNAYSAQATGGSSTWATVNIPIPNKPGVHTLCIQGQTGTTNFQSITLKGAATCTPQCSGKTCGSDGCGGTCGTCSAGQTCNASSQCVTSGGSCTSVKLTATTATASSVAGTNTALKAADGNAGTRWESLAANPQWLAIDYGARRYFDRVVLKWETAAALNYDIQVSDDGVTYRTVRSNPAGAGGTETLTGLNATGRYLRVYAYTRKTQWGDSLWEVEAYGDANPSCGGSSCTPSCAGKQCGTDGCGGSCGTCGTGTACNASNQCQATGGSTCTDVALTRTAAVASSSENAGSAASAAIDGNNATRWSSAFSDPQWLYVDLGANRFVKHLVLRWEAASSADYDIQVSTDASNWTTKFTGKATGASIDTITTGLGVTARYVRMYSRKRNTGYGNSLWELQVFGDTNTACTP